MAANILLGVSAGAADVTLTGDGKLTGEVVAMDGSGTITLVSPFSSEPLLVNGSQVRSVDFGITEDGSAVPDQRLELVNGDILPIRVEGLNDTMLLAASPDLGSFSVPREIVDSVRLGVVPERVVYDGTDNTDGWIRDPGGARNWEIGNGRYLVTGQGMISRDLALPEKFIVRFQLDWNSHPNFCIFLAGPSTPPTERANRYYLQFSGSGFEIRREMMGNARYTPIALLSRTPEQFPGSSLKVEVRVDRKAGILKLYLNGQLEGRYTDPVADVPNGGQIAMLSQAPQDSEQTVSGLEILEWDDRADRHRSEDRGDGKTDSLIGRYGERFGGSLTRILKGESGMVYLFKSDFQKEPVELPEQEVSTVFFASADDGVRQDEPEGLILRLRGGGEMRVSACEFGGKTVKAVHPLLGKLNIDRAGITSIERREIPKAKPVKDR